MKSLRCVCLLALFTALLYAQGALQGQPSRQANALVNGLYKQVGEPSSARHPFWRGYEDLWAVPQ